MVQTDVKSQIAERKIPSTEIVAELKNRVRGGRWARGSMIPSRRALADEFGVSVPTIHKAITNMISEGILLVDANRTFVFGDPDAVFQPDSAPLDSPVASPSAGRHARSKRTVGLVANLKPGHTSMIANTWQVAVLDEVERVLHQHKIKTKFYDLYKGVGSYIPPELYSREIEIAREQELVAAILADRPAALIVYPSAFKVDGDGAIRAFRQAGIPTISTGSDISKYASVNITYDFADEGAQIGAHLVEQGCRRIMFFAPYDAAWARERCQGVRFACEFAGLPADAFEECIADVQLPTQLIISDHADGHYGLGYRYAKERLSAGLRVDGIVAANDQIALGFIAAAREIGLNVRVDYAIAGFDDKDFSRSEGLTTMHPPYANMGREAGQVAARLLDGDDILTAIILKSRLVVRDSSLLVRD